MSIFDISPFGFALIGVAVLIGMVSMGLLIPHKEVERPPSVMVKSLLWVFNIIFGFGLLAWPIGVFGSIFFFDAPGSTVQMLFVWSAAWSIWTYPVIYLIGFIGSVILYKKNYYKASIVFAFLPFINFIWFMISTLFSTLLGIG